MPVSDLHRQLAAIALGAAGRYGFALAGGNALIAHGVVNRFTADVDLVLAVDTENLRRAIAALKSLEYSPRVPVSMDQFVDPNLRQQWANEKGMLVFSLFSPLHPKTTVDLFLEPPFDFSKALGRAARYDLSPGLTGVFCSIDDLIDLKTKSGRPIDLQDIEHLKLLRSKGMS